MQDLRLQQRLDVYYHQVEAVIIQRQSPISGLLPASTAVNLHGDYTDAWVRDNVYSVLAVWGLALAYRRLDDDQGRGYALEHATIKLMRGLLFAMMKQAPKVEAFKKTQDPLDALHAKYDTHSADTVVADDAWGHLQLDATSLFLLTLAQMISSGLAIIHSYSEVNFIQNLVYYISRAYRTPDYGIWERGDKTNNGQPELNASSIAMAKAALEALSDFDLFGLRGSQASVVHVLPDEIARARITLESLLPRESPSKEIDAALFSAISFPAFAVEDMTRVQETKAAIMKKLRGRYGFKRFLRDGHQTVIEDPGRLHYKPEDLRQFEHIECEWPLFYCYALLDGIFSNDRAQVEDCLQQLQNLTVERDGFALLPELYYVPEDKLEAERARPQSQLRLPNDNLPLVWAQSLYLLGQMLAEGLLTVSDIDPLGRHLRWGQQSAPMVQIALLAEDEALQQRLAGDNISSQTPAQVQGVLLQDANALARAYQVVGRNHTLGLSGSPLRRIRSLASSRVYRLRGELVVCLPAFYSQRQFYLTLDPSFLLASLKSELMYIHRHWYQTGRPTLTLLLTHTLYETGREALLAFMEEVRSGYCEGVPVKLGALNVLIQAASYERVDNLHEFQLQALDFSKPSDHYVLPFARQGHSPLKNYEELRLEVENNPGILQERLETSQNLYEQSELLADLMRLQGLDADISIAGQATTIRALLEESYDKAAKLGLWAVVRRSAGLLEKTPLNLVDAVTDILLQQKRIIIGKAYSEASLITRPLPYNELLSVIRDFCREDIRDRVLTQELLLYLSSLIRAEPELFDGLLTLRVGYLILLLTSEYALEHDLSQDEAYEALMALSPFAMRQRLRQVLSHRRDADAVIRRQESLRIRQPQQTLHWQLGNNTAASPGSANRDWWQQRKLDGATGRVGRNFYPNIWSLLEHCKGIVVGDKLERRNRLDSAVILSEMTAGEQNFALRIEHLLNKISAPEYRQLSIEALSVLAHFVAQNPAVYVERTIAIDVLIGHAVRLAWLERFPEQQTRYNQDKAAAWAAFYGLAPEQSSYYLLAAFRYLLESNDTNDISDEQATPQI